MKAWVRYVAATALGATGTVLIAFSAVVGVDAWGRGPLLIPGVLIGTCGIVMCVAGHRFTWKLEAEPLFRWSFQIVLFLGTLLFLIAITELFMFGRSTFEGPGATERWFYLLIFGAISVVALMYIRHRGTQAIPSD
jgi:hypothetical protein